MSKSILVVDDERAFLMAARQIFCRMGSLIDVVDNVEEAKTSEIRLSRARKAVRNILGA